MALHSVPGWHSCDVQRLHRAIGDFTVNEAEIDQLEIAWDQLQTNKRRLQDIISTESHQLVSKWKPGQSAGEFTCLEIAEKEYQTPAVDDWGPFMSAKRIKAPLPPSTSAED